MSHESHDCGGAQAHEVDMKPSAGESVMRSVTLRLAPVGCDVAYLVPWTATEKSVEHAAVGKRYAEVNLRPRILG